MFVTIKFILTINVGHSTPPYHFLYVLIVELKNSSEKNYLKVMTGSFVVFDIYIWNNYCKENAKVYEKRKYWRKLWEHKFCVFSVSFSTSRAIGAFFQFSSFWPLTLKCETKVLNKMMIKNFPGLLLIKVHNDTTTAQKCCKNQSNS